MVIEEKGWRKYNYVKFNVEDMMLFLLILHEGIPMSVKLRHDDFDAPLISVKMNIAKLTNYQIRLLKCIVCKGDILNFQLY